MWVVFSLHDCTQVQQAAEWARNLLCCVLQVVPRSSFQSLLSSTDPLKELTPADGLPALISAMRKAEDLLMTHKYSFF